ncbi:MAG: hypothetical protein H6850_01555 [Alphaproteobacteria bacterium]|nr:MAG: hypothetical protein H6850_01555 [Alphaproteobacteria bacterium]
MAHPLSNYDWDWLWVAFFFCLAISVLGWWYITYPEVDDKIGVLEMEIY